MKKLLLIIITTLLVVSCSRKDTGKAVNIKGEILSGNPENVKFEFIVDNPITGRGETYIAQIDSNDKFSISIPIERIATGRMVIVGTRHDVCLLPGDDLFISIDENSLNFKGKGSARNNFLYQTEINNLWDRAYYEESNKGNLSPKEFLEAMNSFKQKRIDFLNSYTDYGKLEKEFINLYRVETEVIFENLIGSYLQRYSYYNKIPVDSLELPDEFRSIKYFSNITDDSKVISSDYLHNLRNQIYSKARGIYIADSTIDRKDAIYIALFDSLSGKTREYVLTKWICTELSWDKYDTVAINKFKQIEKGELAENTFVKAINKYQEKRSLINQPLHKEFTETVLVDTLNNQLTFGEMMSKYRGNIVYLDLWGMGCGPCRAAMPYSKILREKLGKLPVKFVFVSVEPVDDAAWNKVYEATFTKENHYIMKNGFNSRLLNFMEINWVPNYMIFDKEGKLIDYNADRPSSMVEQQETELEKTLRELAAL
ncbi:MAG: TlpA disulfide reductase family protein [Bacteroidota bacterium]|nr:TlpA disulfide reductase family protein [Bacteroidota bacterium]